jgi:hypothetical protein
MRRWCFAVVVFLFSLPAVAGNVIFVTIDGVRYQEFFGGVQKPGRAKLPRGTDLMPLLHDSAKRGEAWIYGDGITSGTFRVGNRVAMSLPGYRGILSGEFESTCRSNQCPNIDHDTVFDGLIDRGFRSEDLAAFTSWEGLGFALENHPGRIARDVDHDAYPKANVSPEEAALARAIERLERDDKPIWGSRRDRYTYALGRTYLGFHRPRFLYLSFVDSDEYGHLDEYRNYTRSLLSYDVWIADLRRELRKMGDYGDDTTIVLTTDHGRGKGFLWHSHGKWSPSSFRTWAVVFPSPKILREKSISPRKSANYSQLDFRPTFESLLGVEVTSDKRHPGKSLVESRP